MEEKSRSIRERPFEIELAATETTRKKLVKRSWDESKMMWQIAAPAMLTAVTQFSIGFVTSVYVGHLGEDELAAVSIVQNVIEGFVYGVMVSDRLSTGFKLVIFGNNFSLVIRIIWNLF